MFPDFPHNFCNLSSRVVYLVLGLPEVGGHLYNLRGRKVSNSTWHAFNHDPENNLYLCLTSHQFNIILTLQTFQKFLLYQLTFLFFKRYENIQLFKDL